MGFPALRNVGRYAFICLIFLTIIAWYSSSSAYNAVSTGEYHIRLFTDPSPPIAGQETSLIIKILRVSDNAPVGKGKVLLNVAETTDDNRRDGIRRENPTTFMLAREADEFGNYELKTRFERHGAYYIEAVIPEIKRVRLETPLRAGFTVASAPPDRSDVRRWVVFLSVIFLTLGALYVFHIRRRVVSTDPVGFNLLDIPWVKRLFRWKYIQPVFQVPLLIGLAVLLLLSFFDIQDGGKNLATKFIWTIWWAGVIFTFVLAGRLWCFMCPVGAISEWTSRLVKPTRRFPAVLRNVWIANILFVLFTWLDMVFGVVDKPAVTGTLFVLILIIAVGTAVFYERRTFCRHVCPIGGLIGIYSMFSPVELRSKDQEVCKRHRQKECVTGNKKGLGCPMFEIVPKMDSNTACNFCGECVKSCSKDNITLRFRTFFKDAWTTRNRALDEAALVIALVGITIIATGEMVGPWNEWLEAAMDMVPAGLLGIEYRYTLEVVSKSVVFISIALLVIPGLMILAAFLSNRLAGPENHRGLKQTFITFGYMFIPIGLSMHLAHNMGHLFNESGGIVPALQRVINEFTPIYAGEPDWLLASEPLIAASFLYWIQMLLLLVFYGYSLYAGHRLSVNYYGDGTVAFKAFMPMAGLSFILMMGNVLLLSLPMMARHVH